MSFLLDGDKAKENSPWKDVFPDGVMYYLASPVGEEGDRFNKLKDRRQNHLPAGDALVTALVPRIEQVIADFSAAEEAKKAAQRTVEARRVERERAETAWRTLMDRIYSGLRAEHGKNEAERFFKKPQRRGQKKGDDVESDAEG